jgi:hypothetical protein
VASDPFGKVLTLLANISGLRPAFIDLAVEPLENALRGSPTLWERNTGTVFYKEGAQLRYHLTKVDVKIDTCNVTLRQAPIEKASNMDDRDPDLKDK